MNHFQIALDTANRIAKQYNAIEQGVAIHVVPDRNGDLNYVIAGPDRKHTLCYSVTPPARLAAHLIGFIN